MNEEIMAIIVATDCTTDQAFEMLAECGDAETSIEAIQREMEKKNA